MAIVTKVMAFPYGQVPGPLVGSSTEIVTGAVITEFSTGRIRKRLNGYGVNHNLSLQWLLTDLELRHFYGWWRNILGNGTAEFLLANLPLLGRGLSSLWVGVFTSNFKAVSNSGGQFDVEMGASMWEAPFDTWEQFLTNLNPKWQDYFLSLPEAINGYFTGRWNSVL